MSVTGGILNVGKAAEGPISVTAPEVGAIWTGLRQEVTWREDRFVTNECPEVDIRLSLDDGQTFLPLSQKPVRTSLSRWSVDIPALPTSKASIAVACAGTEIRALSPAFSIRPAKQTDWDVSLQEELSQTRP
jgi:hypothetical protein